MLFLCPIQVNNSFVNQSIYQFSDKDCSVPDDIDLWRSVWTGLYVVFFENISCKS